MTREDARRGDPLFRDEAVQWAAGTRPGDVARLSTRQTTRLFRLVVGVGVAVAAAGLAVRVPATAHGSGVIDPPRGQFSALLPKGTQVAEGARITLNDDGGTGQLRVSANEITKTPDGYIRVTGHIPTGTVPAHAVRVEVTTGTTSLLRLAVDLQS